MSEPKNKTALFEDRQARQQWDEDAEKWWFSVVDVIEILTDQPDHDRARKYWSVMKTRLKQEGAEPATIFSQLKMKAYDGKSRLTDVADTEQLFRIIQSVPSPKAEPFKLWLAKVGNAPLDRQATEMSKLEQLLTELCPDGVEVKTLGEVATGMYAGQTIEVECA